MKSSIGYIENIQGHVQVKHSDGVVENMYEHAELFEGDSLITKRDSTASLKLNNGKTVGLDIDSTATIEKGLKVVSRGNIHDESSIAQIEVSKQAKVTSKRTVRRAPVIEEEPTVLAAVAKKEKAKKEDEDDDEFELETATGLSAAAGTLGMSSRVARDGGTNEILASAGNSLEKKESGSSAYDYLDQEALMASVDDNVVTAFDNGFGGTAGDDVIVGTSGDDIINGGAGNDYVRGGDGDDTINGGDGDDTLEGGAGDDVIDGGEGDDTISGGDGNDTLIGGAGDDIIDGGAGDDVIEGNDGNDTIDGGSGNDTIDGGAGNDVINGDDGDDVINGGDGDDTLNGGDGNDTIDGGNGNDIINGNDGDDTLMGGEGDDTIDGGAGDDYIDGGAGDDTLYGGSGNDTIIGGTGDDSIVGGDGDDYIDAGDGKDIVDGGLGDDTIHGGEDIDYIFGGDGDDSIYGEGGDDTIFGGNGDDYIEGGAGNDDIDGGAGNDTILGGEGNDTIDGGDDNDTIYGGAGNDIIDGGAGNDSIYGEDGNDTLNGGLGDDYIDGGAGNDVINGNEGDDTLMGGEGDDYIDGGAGDDIIEGNAGNDTLIGGEGNDTINGGDDNDSIYGGAGQDTLNGGSGDDYIEGGDDNDVINGNDGDDTLHGGEGDDIIDGGSGNDSIYGEGGNDTLIGGTGNDYIEGGAGQDTITAGEGNDIVDGGDDNDIIFGEAGDDTLNGGAGDDAISGGLDNDVIDGGDGADSIFGNEGDDTLYGGEGNDTIDGGAGNDVIYGNGGDDTLIGGSGDDYLNGGAGDDLLDASEGNDVVDGAEGSDTVLLDGTIDDYGVTKKTDEDGIVHTILIDNSGNTTELINVENIDFKDDGTDSPVVVGDLVQDTLYITDSANEDEDYNFTDTQIEGYLTGSGLIQAGVTIVGFGEIGQDMVVGSTYDIGNGTITDNGSGNFVFRSDENYNGNLSFSIFLSDGNSIKALAEVMPIDDPTITQADSITIDEDSSATGNVLDNDSDVDTNDIGGLALQIVTFNVDGQDYNADTQAEILNVGSLEIASNGDFTFTPIANYDGTVPTVLYTTNTGVSDHLDINITPLNDTAVITLETDTLAIEEDKSARISFSVEDVESGTIVPILSADHGSVEINNGDILYTPTANYNGTDTITVSVLDSDGTTVTKNISVNISAVGDAPVITTVDSLNIDEDSTAVTIDLSIAEYDNETLDPAILSASNGTVALDGNGNILYTPDANFNGSDTIVVSVTDASGASSTKEIAVNVNAVVDAATDDTITTAENAPLSGNILANDTDYNQASEYSVKSYDISGSTYQADGSITTITGIGTISISSDGSYQFSPELNYFGAVPTITYLTNTDVRADLNISVNGQNDAPVITIDSSATVNEDTPLVLALSVNDTENGILSASSATALHGIVSIDSANQITYTPTGDYFGSDTITITASDANGATTSKTVAITVKPINDAPILTVDENIAINEDSTTNISYSVSDPDGEILTPTASALHGNVVVSDGNIAYTPDANYNGADTLTVTVKDAHGVEVSKTVDFTVNSINDAPIAASGMTLDNEGSIVFDYDSVNGHNTEDQSVIFTEANLISGVAIDVDGDTLTISSFTPPDASVGSFTDWTDPTSGLAEGEIRFTPAQDYNGVVNFSYVISDGNGGEIAVKASSTFDPIDDAAEFTINETLSVRQNENGVFTYTLSDIDNTISGVTYSSANGATITADGSNSGTFTYNEDTLGTDTVTMTITHADGTTEDKSFDINVNSQNAIFIGESPEDFAFDFPESLLLNYIKEANPHLVSSGAITDFTGIDHIAATELDNSYYSLPDLVWEDIDGDGVVDGQYRTYDVGYGKIIPLGYDLNAGEDMFRFVPNENFNGENQSFWIQLDNYESTVVEVYANILPVNDNPLADALAPISVNEDNIAAGSVSGTDIDGDVLTYKLDTQAEHGIVTINATTGEYVYTPDANYDGLDSFSFVVNDGTVDSAAQTVAITVIPGVISDYVGRVSESALEDGTNPSSEGRIAEGNLLDSNTISITNVSIDGQDAVVDATYPELLVLDTESGILYVATADVVVNAHAYSAGDYYYELQDGTQNSQEVFTYTDSNGDSANLTIKIEDDVLQSQDVNKYLVEKEDGFSTNLVLMVDISGSMDDLVSGGNGQTRLDLTKDALKNLIDAYAIKGDVNMKLYVFSDDSYTDGIWYTSTQIDTVKGYIDQLNANGGTDYDAVTAQTATDHALPTASDTQIYFLSDGEPTGSDGGFFGIGANNNTLESDEATAWSNYVNSIGATVNAIGVGTGTDSAQLDLVGLGSSTVVTNELDLSNALIQTLSDGTVSGNMVGEGDYLSPVKASANGGKITQIEMIDENGNVLIDPNGNPMVVTTADLTNGEITLTTPLGATVTVNFNTGNYTYSGIDVAGKFGQAEHVRITVEDNYGATITGTFTLNIDTPDAGGNDVVLYDSSASLNDGREGIDTLILNSGENLDFATAHNIQNIEIINLLGGDHTISNITVADIAAMTDANNNLSIYGDKGDDVLAFADATDVWTPTGESTLDGRTIESWTGVSADGQTSVTVNIDQAIITSLDDTIISDGVSAVDGGIGLDTLVLDSGIELDFNNVDNIKNIEVIDLQSENDQLHNISADDILSMTDDDNYLEIVGVGTIDFSNDAEWTKVESADGESTTYTATVNLSDIVTVEVENIIHVDHN